MAPEDTSGAPGRTGAPAVTVGMTAREAQAGLGRFLAAAGVEDGLRDARLLLSGALEATAEDLLKAPGRTLTSEEASKLVEFAGRRAAFEPVSRILGVRGFFGRMFRITPATLDPRPCSETVIEAALDVVSEAGWRGRQIRVLDVGTGSGALLVTLLAELPDATGVGTDVSDAALAVAKENAARIGVGARATFLNRRDLDDVDGPFDLLVANPPYIPHADIRGLAPDVRDYDPQGALDGGRDGLDRYRALSREIMRVVPDGWALFEVGAGQAEPVQDILRSEAQNALGEIRVWQDLGQHTRCVAVRTHL